MICTTSFFCHDSLVLPTYIEHNREEEASISSKPKAAPKAGAKKTVPAKIATPSTGALSKEDTPKGSGSGTLKRGEIPSFEDALNAAPESFSASNLVGYDCLRL